MSDGDSLEILGYYTAGDGGGGTFYWDATSTETDNGGTVIQATGVTTGRWLRVFSGAVNVKEFGAKGDGITDDTVAINFWLESVYSSKSGVLDAPEEYYKITSALATMGDISGVKIVSAGQPDIAVSGQTADLRYEGEEISTLWKIIGCSGVVLDGIVIDGNALVGTVIEIAGGNNYPGYSNRSSASTYSNCMFLNGTVTSLTFGDTGGSQLDRQAFINCTITARKDDANSAGLYGFGGNTYGTWIGCAFSGDTAIRLKSGGFTFNSWCSSGACTDKVFHLENAIQGGLNVQGFYDEGTPQFFKCESTTVIGLSRIISFDNCTHFGGDIASEHKSNQNLTLTNSLGYGFTSDFYSGGGKVPTVIDFGNSWDHIADYGADGSPLFRWSGDTDTNYMNLKGIKKVFRDSTSDLIISDNYSNQIFTNDGTTMDVLYTLPLASDGQYLTFIQIENNSIRIDTSGTERIYGITDTDGDKIKSGGVGATVTLVGKSGNWYALSYWGTWTDDN
jgi:hypothetical protein